MSAARLLLTSTTPVKTKTAATTFCHVRRSMPVAMPITVMALLTVVVWPFSLIVLFVGLFLGTRYAFRGPDINAAAQDIVSKAQEKTVLAIGADAQVE